MAITFGSLFAGIGGMDLGLERAGMECKWQVEIDDYASRVLAKHWPTVHREKDVRECGAANLENVDLIAAGFPCQDISYAGKGAGLKGERSGLFYEVARIVSEMAPRYVVLENVSALLTRGLDQVLGTLASLGYDAEWHCIPAAYVGAPHIRDRVFIIGFQSRNADCKHDGQKQKWHPADSDSSRIGFRYNKEESPIVADSRCELRESRASERSSSKTSSEWEPEANDAKRCGEDVTDTNIKDVQGQRQEPIGIESQQRNPSYESWWAIEPDVGRVANGIPSRVDRLKGLGNAVVPQVAEYIGRQIVKFEKGG